VPTISGGTAAFRALRPEGSTSASEDDHHPLAALGFVYWIGHYILSGHHTLAAASPPTTGHLRLLSFHRQPLPISSFTAYFLVAGYHKISGSGGVDGECPSFAARIVVGKN
jgi:hypothetical protein